MPELGIGLVDGGELNFKSIFPEFLCKEKNTGEELLSI